MIILFCFNGNPLIAEYALFIRNQYLKGMDLKFPRRLSYDYLQMFSSQNDSSYKSYRLYKGIPFSMINIIVNAPRNQEAYSDEYNSTEKGNRIIHLISAFSDNLTIINKMKDKREAFNRKNANGWTPFFVANFRNKDNMHTPELIHFINQNITDYFGNTASFYAKP